MRRREFIAGLGGAAAAALISSQFPGLPETSKNREATMKHFTAMAVGTLLAFSVEQRPRRFSY